MKITKERLMDRAQSKLSAAKRFMTLSKKSRGMKRRSNLCACLASASGAMSYITVIGIGTGKGFTEDTGEIFDCAQVIVNKPVPGSGLGIDISHWQGKIDWHKVATMPTKWGLVEWAYAKASTGATGRDPRFIQNVNAATAAGLPIGAYHWAAPNKPAAEDAANFINAMNPVRDKLTLVPMIDVEQAPEGAYKNPQAFRNWIVELAQAVMAAGYGMPIIYINAYFAQKYLGKRKLGNLPIWVPQYNRTKGDYLGTETGPKKVFTTTKDWIIWQFTEEGKVPGIKTPVDLNSLRPGFFSTISGKKSIALLLVVAAAGAAAVVWWWSKRKNRRA
jgi:GH25 family lysozyme M1 (1,4-beta-N-acetylmuramidase)